MNDFDNTRRKTTWNSGAAPAPRQGSAGWPDTEEPVPATVEEEDVSDMPYAALHAGWGPDEATSTLEDAFTSATVNLPEEEAVPVNMANLFALPAEEQSPEVAVESTAPVNLFADTEPAQFDTTSEPAHSDPEPAQFETEPTPNDFFHTSSPEGTDMFAPADAAHNPFALVAPELNIDPPGSDLDLFTAEEPDDTPETPPDLFDLFDDEYSTAGVTDITPTREAHSAPHDVLRELNVGVNLTDEQAASVSDLLGLAAAGDPDLQRVITSFEITKDPEKDAQQLTAYEAAVSKLMQTRGVRIYNPADYPIVIRSAYDQLLGLGPLGPLWRDPDITDIMVTGPDKVVVDRNGFLYRTNVRFRSLEHLHDTGRRLSVKVDDRGVSRSNSLVTVQLSGARVQLAWPPVARSGGNITIRKHRNNLTLPELLARGALSIDMAALLSDAVMSQATLLISGGTATGKTTYLNIASGFIPDTERVIVIEDAAELDLTNTFVEYYLTKQRSSADDTVVIEFGQLLQAALRMRPDRIIVGEILSPEGADAMLTASYTGHDGTMSTIHANNPDEALSRLTDLVRSSTGAPDDIIRRRVHTTFDLLIHVDKNKHTGIRYVSEMATVNDDETINTMFTGVVDVTEDEDGNPVGHTRFERVGTLGADTSLAVRMRDNGIDTAPWERT